MVSIKKNKSLRKILRLVYSYDEDFITEWADTIRKGMFKHILKTTIVTTIIMGIMGMYFLLNKFSLHGYEQSQTIYVALTEGVILGIILSLIQWGLGNERYNRLKEKK